MVKRHWATVTARTAAVSVAIAMGLIASAGGAHAQTCPTDLTSLNGQIQTPSLQAILTTSIDQLVANAGGLAQAIANAQAQLASLVALQPQIPPDASPSTSQEVSDGILITQTAIQALQCRQSGS